jgi:hypothetical protein
MGDQFSLGRIAYEAYASAMGFTVFDSTYTLPPFDDLTEQLRSAWQTAAEAVKA